MTIVNCKDCHNENCRECGNYMRSTCWAFKEAPKLTTNYDRIRAKSVEELDEIMVGDCQPNAKSGKGGNMKIYIEEKDIPESCFDCPFMLHRSFCLVNTKIEFTDEEYSELKGRYIGCPLVPLPPHGDLIDRSALVIRTAVPLDGKPYQYVHIDHIKAAPAVIKAKEDE